jgi:hypothetical protein
VKPSRYEGIADDSKQIDGVHQFANNIRRLPTHAVQTTNEVNGKVFLLVPINEGGMSPIARSRRRLAITAEGLTHGEAAAATESPRAGLAS